MIIEKNQIKLLTQVFIHSIVFNSGLVTIKTNQFVTEFRKTKRNHNRTKSKKRNNASAIDRMYK